MNQSAWNAPALRPHLEPRYNGGPQYARVLHQNQSLSVDRFDIWLPLQDYAEDTMNELLGWYGYGKLDHSESQQLKHHSTDNDDDDMDESKDEDNKPKESGRCNLIFEFFRICGVAER